MLRDLQSALDLKVRRIQLHDSAAMTMSPPAPATCMLLSMGSCVIIETQLFRFTILNVLHICRASAWVDVSIATSRTYTVNSKISREKETPGIDNENDKFHALPTNHGFSECAKSKQSDFPYGPLRRICAFSESAFGVLDSAKMFNLFAYMSGECQYILWWACLVVRW